MCHIARHVLDVVLLVWPFFEVDDLHLARVGDLLRVLQEDLLADDLRHKEALRLVADHGLGYGSRGRWQKGKSISRASTQASLWSASA